MSRPYDVSGKCRGDTHVALYKLKEKHVKRYSKES